MNCCPICENDSHKCTCAQGLTVQDLVNKKIEKWAKDEATRGQSFSIDKMQGYIEGARTWYKIGLAEGKARGLNDALERIKNSDKPTK